MQVIPKFVGVQHAIKNVNDIIAPALIAKGFDVTKQNEIDKFMIDLDGTPNKCKIISVIISTNW